MKKGLFIFFSAMIVLACGTVKSTESEAEKENLDGTWVPVEQEFAGNVLTPQSFEKQRLVLSDTAYKMTAESTDLGVVKYANGKMDIYSKEGVNKGKHFMAIYKFKNELLTICYNLGGDKYPEKFETEGHGLYFMCVFKREESQ